MSIPWTTGTAFRKSTAIESDLARRVILELRMETSVQRPSADLFDRPLFNQFSDWTECLIGSENCSDLTGELMTRVPRSPVSI